MCILLKELLLQMKRQTIQFQNTIITVYQHSRIKYAKKRQNIIIAISFFDIRSFFISYTRSDMRSMVWFNFCKKTFRLLQYFFLTEQNTFWFQMQQKYFCKSRSDNAPHIYSVADSAYQDVLHHEEPQHIIFSGETYSGKTTNLKRILDHLNYLGLVSL